MLVEKKYWHCNISQSRAKTSGDNLLYYIIIITIIIINMLLHQDTDERHTALIAAVNNNDAKVPPEAFTFLLKLQNWRLIKIFQVVDALMEHPDLDMNKRYICVLMEITATLFWWECLSGTEMEWPPTSLPRLETTQESFDSLRSPNSSCRWDGLEMIEYIYKHWEKETCEKFIWPVYFRTWKSNLIYSAAPKSELPHEEGVRGGPGDARQGQDHFV